MKTFFYQLLRLVTRTILGILGFILLYLVIAIILSSLPCNTDFSPAPDGIDMYIRSNGIHTDLVLPAKNEYMDWTKLVNSDNTISKDSNVLFIAFGWGDKGFFLETPQWKDLKLSTLLKAIFSLNTSAMHVTNYESLNINESCKKIRISRENYQKLVEYVKASFLRDDWNNFMYIKNHHYNDYDSFYEATGSYSLFYTCNTWANQGLKCCGIKTCVWTPFDKGIFFHL